MFTIIKGKTRMDVTNRQALDIFLSSGWELVKVGDKPNIEEPAEPTKKQLQEQLEAKGIVYSPRDNKQALQAKLEGSQPTDDFDDGLLKG